MTDWSLIAELGTAGGTLILALATFGATRESQRASRVSERALQSGLRPLLFPTRLGDPEEKVGFQDQHYLRVEGGRAVIDVTDDVIYLSMSLRNVGNGIAVLDRWCLQPNRDPSSPDHAPLEEFRRLTRDLYVPANDQSFWQGALRDSNEELFDDMRRKVKDRERIMMELLYGDIEGGQRTVSRFAFMPVKDDSWLTVLSRHWYLDSADPR